MRFFITGGTGFIGSNLVEYLNWMGHIPIVLLRRSSFDEQIRLLGQPPMSEVFFSRTWKNLAGLNFIPLWDDNFKAEFADVLIHLSADASTKAPMSKELIDSNVFRLGQLATKGFGKVLYASSAATYGAEENDFTERIDGLKPLNAYGMSKLMQDRLFSEYYMGLRFFNVYGPRESHKAGMKSIATIYIEEHQKNGSIDVFKPYNRPDIKPGEQSRDSIYVEDVCYAIYNLAANTIVKNGIFNIGTGKAITFNSMVSALSSKANYVEMPESIRDQYQYRTCADIKKLSTFIDTSKFRNIKEGMERTIDRNLELSLK